MLAWLYYQKKQMHKELPETETADNDKRIHSSKRNDNPKYIDT